MTRADGCFWWLLATIAGIVIWSWLWHLGQVIVRHLWGSLV